MAYNLGFSGVQDSYPQTGGPDPFPQGGWAGVGPSAELLSLNNQYKTAMGTPIEMSQAERTANFQSGGSLYQQSLDEEKAMRDRVAAMRANAPAGVGVVGIDGNAFYGTPSSGGTSGGSTPFGGVQSTQQTAQTGPAAGGGNPYLQQQADAITNQVNQNWTRVQQPSIRSGAMAAGGFGGSRQGVVEANALNDINQGLSNSLANLYGTDWTNAQNRGLQQQQITNSYNLGLGNLALGNDTLDANIYNSNFANQMASANFGLNAYNTMMGYGQQGINGATTIQNTPLQYQQYFNNAYNAGGGQGGTSTSVQGTTSNPWMTASTAVRALGY